jgi:hypothetical protein
MAKEGRICPSSLNVAPEERPNGFERLLVLDIDWLARSLLTGGSLPGRRAASNTPRCLLPSTSTRANRQSVTPGPVWSNAESMVSVSGSVH